MLGKNNKVRDLKANAVLHYKSYKVGKHWVFAGLAALSVGAGIFFGGLNYTAYADVNDNIQATETNNTNQTQQADNTTTKSPVTTNTSNNGSDQAEQPSNTPTTNNVSAASPTTQATQTDPSKPVDNTQPATAKTSEPNKVEVTPTENVPTKVPESETLPATAKVPNKAIDSTPDVNNLGNADNDQIAAAQATAATTYKATGTPQKITASLDGVAPSVQLGNTTLSATGENDVSLNDGSATKTPTILITGNASAGDTLKIDLPPIYQVESFDTDFEGTKDPTTSAITYKFNQDTAYTLHVYTASPAACSVSMDTDGTTPMNLTVTKDGVATVYPLKVTSSPALTTQVYVYNDFNGQGRTLNLADAVNGVIPSVSLEVYPTYNNYVPEITSGSYSIDVPKGFVLDPNSSTSGITVTQPGGAGSPVNLAYANYTSLAGMVISGSINVTDQTVGNETFAKNNNNGTLQNGTHSALPVSITYSPLTYVNVAAISQPQNYVTSYAGINTWPKFDNDKYGDIGLYSVVTGGQSATATTDQVTFNVPNGVIATKITTPSYAANVTVTLKSGQKVQYNNIAGSVITGTATDPIVSVTSKSIDQQTYAVGTKANQSEYAYINTDTSRNNRFFVSGHLTNANVGDSYTVTTSNDDTNAPQSDTSKFTVADYGVIAYSGYGSRTTPSSDSNGIRYHSGDTIHDTYTFTVDSARTINGPATANYYVVVPSNAILKSLDNITVATSGSQSAIKEVLPQTLNNQEIVKINITNPERTLLPNIILNYQVSPTAKLGQTVTLNTDNAGSGRFIMTGDFHPQSYAMPTSSTTTLQNFANLVGDTSSNVYVEDEPATYTITSAAAFSADIPAKTNKDVSYPEDMGQDSSTFTQKYNENGTLRVNAANTTASDLKNVNSLVTLPTKADGNDFSVQIDGSKIANMTIPVGTTVLYSPNKVTSSQSIDTAANGFVTAANITDWSTIQSVLVQSPTLVSLGQTTVYLPIKVADYTAGQPSNPDTVTLNATATDVKSEKPMNIQAKSTINLSVPKTTVNVHYVNGSGTMLAATSTGQETVGGTYNWTNPTVLGYHVNTGEPTSYTVTTSDIGTKEINVVYTPNDEPLTVNYVNQQGTVFTTEHQTGQFGQTVNIEQKTFNGYTAQAGNPTTYTFTKDGANNNVVTLYYIAQDKAITIHYVYADGGGTAAPDAPVNGIIGGTYSQTSPTIANATADQTTVTGTLAPNSPDVTVTYTRDAAHADIIYVDDDNNNQTVSTQPETGDAGATTSFNLNVPANYEMVTPATSTSITFLNDNATNNTADNVTIHLKHGTKTVTPGQPQVPGDPIPGTKVNWPTGVNSSDLNRTVNETVQYVYANGGKVASDQTQTVTFQRAAAVDAVTGDFLGYLPANQVAAYEADPTSVILSPTDGWAVQSGNADFKALTSPTEPGYTADEAATNPYTITPTTGSLKLTVTYTPDKQLATVNYVDDDANGAQVHQDNLNGVSNGTQNYTKVLQAVKGGLTALGYQIVGTDLPANNLITFDHDDATPQTYTVHLTHQTATFTPDQPGQPNNPIFSNNPNGPKWPAGVDSDNLEKTVTETVNYVYAKDNSTAAPKVTDAVTFTRTGTVDLITRAVTYTPWAAKDKKTSFNAKKSPVINGYLADVTEVPEVDNVTPTSNNVDKTVTYSQLGSYTTNLTNVPDTPYPNDPNDASKITTPVIPYEPGYQPYGPDGNPLKPVDPNDLTKGYLPPVPTNSLSNTPITYKPITVSGGDTPTIPVTPRKDTQTPETPANPVNNPRTPVTPAPAAKTKVPVPADKHARPSNASNTPSSSLHPAGGEKGQATAAFTTSHSVTSRSKASGSATATTSRNYMEGKASGNVTMTTASVKAASLKAHGNSTEQASQATKKLPQTNEQSTNALSLLGLSFLSFLGIGKIRRRKND